MKKIIFILSITVLSFLSCSIEEEDKYEQEFNRSLEELDVNDGLDGTSIDFWDNEDGSTTFIIYLDEGKENRNHRYDLGENWFNKKTFYPPIDGVNGQDGLDGTSFVITQEVFRDNEGRDCVQITTFHDVDGNREYSEEIDELETQTVICSGIDGSNGSSVLVTTKPATENECENGGIITTIHDDNGVFIGEYVTCNGNDGTNGVNGTDGNDGVNGTNSMILSEIIEEGDYGCEHGGLKIIIMNDKNADGDFEDLGEVNVEIICNLKCVIQEEMCTDVYDTISCRNNNEAYVMWIEGTYYYNIDLQFEIIEENKAILYGKVNQHNSTNVFIVNVTFSNIVQEPIKEHECLTTDSSNWIQYGDLNGTIRSVDGSVELNLTRRGEPAQYGIGANVTSSTNTLGMCTWFTTSGDAEYKGDFNILICQ